MDVGAEADTEAEAGVEIGMEVDGEEETELGLEAEAGAGADGSCAGAETNVSQPVNQSGSQGVSQTDQEACRSANERRKNRPSKRVYAHARTTRDGRREDGDRKAKRGVPQDGKQQSARRGTSVQSTRPGALNWHGRREMAGARSARSEPTI